MTAIRAVRPDDLTQLLEMIAALAAHHGDTPGANEAALRRDLFGSGPWLHGLIVDGVGSGAGYALLLPTAQAQNGIRGLDLHHLYVRSDLRGRGLGRALVDGAVTLARDLGCGYLIVGADPDNTGAAAAYSALGFAPRRAGLRFRRDL